MLNHVVLMKFNETVTDEQVAELERMLDDLPNKIVEIHTYEFGRDVIRGERSYDFALVSLFANPESLQRYQTHSAHLEVAATLGKMCENILTVDFYGIDAGSLTKDEPEHGFEQLFK